jgi:hypothetical protein
MARQKRSEARWRQLVAEFEASELTQEAFARSREINVGTFRWWLYRIRSGAMPARFVEVVSESSEAASGPVTVSVAGNVTIEFQRRPSVEYLGTLVRYLAERRS